MARIKRRDSIELSAEEITVLLKVVGMHSPKSIDELGLDVDAFEDIYAALTKLAYAPMLEGAP